ncbi:MAG: hypothetical protein FWH48_10640 [Oscillospiraceae bacterium]|nr:hypothetical protein [Oscillospiraceae bacterium]
MKKIKNFKLFAGIALFVESMLLVAVIIVLSIQKKSIPKAIIAILAAGSAMSALLLLSYKDEEDRKKRLRESDVFYDHEYCSAFDDDEDYGLGLDEHLNPIRDDEE